MKCPEKPANPAVHGQPHHEEIIGEKRFLVIVKPNSKKNELVGFDAERNAYIVRVSAPADKNKANVELCRFLSKKLKSRVRIISGLRSREKVISKV